MALDSLASARILLVGSSEWVDDAATAFDERTTLLRADTADAALTLVAEQSPDCLVTAYDLPDSTGVALLGDVRDVAPTLPVVVGAADGSESAASDAIAAGVDDYVVIDEAADRPSDVLLDRTRGVLEATPDRDGHERRARQFEAMFADARTATWVLDPDGSLVRANQTAREIGDDAASAQTGGPFWTLPWLSGDERTRADVRRLVERGVDGAFAHAVVTLAAIDGPSRVFDLSVRPVDDGGSVDSIVVEAVDITDRVELERDLRRSEELHRVTLNNMTDTVLMTDEDGEYTYVCPNVHFIFGYTAAEIREQKPIEELLGEDLFDREELARRGVCKNIECTATDKAGREHTLLVNVREVSIQDGTLLYSCRDITKRKRREDALAALHGTARRFLYAETHQEIAQRVVDDAPAVLGVDAVAVYLFDDAANELRPAAYSPSATELHGPLPTVAVDDETLPGHSFVADDTLFFDDVHHADRLDNRATEFRGTTYIPLGDHGVFVAASPEVGAFDDVTRELSDLFAATTEAALDRVAREAQLRERDRQLQRQNEQLSALNRINDTIREIGRTIVRAETREEIDRAVCERLTDGDRFSFAWIGSVDPAHEVLEPRAWAGDEQGYLDCQSFAVGASDAEPSGQAAATDTVTLETNVAAGLRDEPWRTEALRRDFTSVLSIPLVYNDLSHGVLSVYADSKDAFDETARAVLAELGETIASALSALERKNALLTPSVTRVEFAVDDPTFLLSRLADQAECTVSYQGGIRQTDAGSALFLTVEGAPVDAVVDHATEMAAVDEVQVVSADENGGVVRLVVARFLAQELADHGALLREVTASQGGTELRVDVPERITVREITELIGQTVSNVELRSRRSVERPTQHDVRSTVLDEMTERQLEVVQTAYYSGFFESPRETNGKELAAMLDISPPAFYQHVRAVQQKLFTAVFEAYGLLESGRFNS
ncbi:bacterio-opsin activator domain-containing protein [Halomicrobium mukohataei]|uniref:PAS domain S-box protein n=2 Tax=Halomicrobium mukohataei TaxID=57705 RepID=A0A4D6KFA7_9EURY|nr:bacterio-opsin activator domain-containing protein [Halomicrobium mukohataei]ACV49467.1 putative PAS/PAC sensor protein [Halomicrobium mukohataei DSM 12286]QCD67288.1 PAS domain S-box protein [Halomicrobium mukohataei]